MGREVVIAAGQVGSGITTDLKKNVAQLNDLLIEAGEKGVNILSFTEICAAPFFPPSLSPDYEKFCLKFPDEILNPLFETAKTYQMVLILPFAEKDGIDYYNSAVISDADGTILGKYRKVTLPSVFPSPPKGGTGTYEKLYFRPGNLGFPVFNTRYGKVGIQICYDRKFPEGSRILALEGAEIIFIPSCASTETYGNHKARIDHWDLSSRARAYENGVFVVLSNKAGQAFMDTSFKKETVFNYIGRSLIINPNGETIAMGSPDQWEIVMAKVDLDEVHRAQMILPFWRDRMPSEYGRLIKK
ncbi:MAG: carbon-nitrogen hydrolase family protein [Thermodesulfobacteriota bacterium]|nr:carbon-nitrogen hydrolase family protein [Thermodesulfobacteriota bacterium]